MEPFADAADVTAVSSSLNDDQTAALDGLIAQASTLLRGWGLARGVSIDTLIVGDEVREEIARLAVVNATKRALGILDGALEVSTAIDDWRETIRRDKDAIAAGMFIAPGDIVGLLPGKRPSRFGTIRMGSAL